MAEEKPEFSELGTSGLSVFNGLVTEAYLPQLRWPQSYLVYNDMRQRSPLLRSLTNSIILLSRKAQWKFEKSDESTPQEAVDFGDSLLQDINFPDFVDDALSALSFGWSWHMPVYGRRSPDFRSPDPEDTWRSHFKDGKIGWRALAYRRQSSLQRWKTNDSTGRTLGMWQLDPPNPVVLLPSERAVHYIPFRDGDNPEGFALYASCYRPWYFITSFEVILGVGLERSLVGWPVFTFDEKPSVEDMSVIRHAAAALLASSEKAYIALPKGAHLTFATVANPNATTLLEVMKYYNLSMLQTALADFIMLGSSSVGSYALGADKSQLFIMAINGILDALQAALAMYAVPQIFRYNYPDLDFPPRLTHTGVDKPIGLAEFGTFLTAVSQILQLTDADVERIRLKTDGLLAPEIGERSKGLIEPPQPKQPAPQEKPASGAENTPPSTGQNAPPAATEGKSPPAPKGKSPAPDAEQGGSEYHLGPGAHPLTHTPQDVHGGWGSASAKLKGEAKALYNDHATRVLGMLAAIDRAPTSGEARQFLSELRTKSQEFAANAVDNNSDVDKALASLYQRSHDAAFATIVNDSYIRARIARTMDQSQDGDINYAIRLYADLRQNHEAGIGSPGADIQSLEVIRQRLAKSSAGSSTYQRDLVSVDILEHAMVRDATSRSAIDDLWERYNKEGKGGDTYTKAAFKGRQEALRNMTNQVQKLVDNGQIGDAQLKINESVDIFNGRVAHVKEQMDQYQNGKDVLEIETTARDQAIAVADFFQRKIKGMSDEPGALDVSPIVAESARRLVIKAESADKLSDGEAVALRTTIKNAPNDGPDSSLHLAKALNLVEANLKTRHLASAADATLEIKVSEKTRATKPTKTEEEYRAKYYGSSGNQHDPGTKFIQAEGKKMQTAEYTYAGNIKNDLVGELAKRGGFTYDEVNQTIASWKTSSNDNNRNMLTLQKTAADMFGTELSPWQQEKYKKAMKSGDGMEAFYDHPDPEAARRRFLKTMYDLTQEKLKEAGIEELVLYRGVTPSGNATLEALHDITPGTKVGLRYNPMESWSSDMSVASSSFGGYGGVTMRAVVPRSRIIGSCVSGFGCSSEFEFIVLGQPKGDKGTIIRNNKGWWDDEQFKTPAP